MVSAQALLMSVKWVNGTRQSVLSTVYIYTQQTSFTPFVAMLFPRAFSYTLVDYTTLYTRATKAPACLKDLIPL